MILNEMHRRDAYYKYKVLVVSSDKISGCEILASLCKNQNVLIINDISRTSQSATSNDPWSFIKQTLKYFRFEDPLKVVLAGQLLAIYHIYHLLKRNI